MCVLFLQKDDVFSLASRAEAPPPAKGITELVRRKVAKYVFACDGVLCVMVCYVWWYMWWCDTCMCVMVWCVCDGVLCVMVWCVWWCDMCAMCDGVICVLCVICVLWWCDMCAMCDGVMCIAAAGIVTAMLTTRLILIWPTLLSESLVSIGYLSIVLLTTECSCAAMSFPGSGLETIYRNNVKDVAKMLKTKHQENYMVWGLCCSGK